MTLKSYMETELLDYLPDIAHSGAQSGFPGLTYYSDTVKLYNEHEDEIWGLLHEMTSDYGYNHILALIATFNGSKNVVDMEQFKNLLVWVAAEYYAALFVEQA